MSEDGASKLLALWQTYVGALRLLVVTASGVRGPRALAGLGLVPPDGRDEMRLN